MHPSSGVSWPVGTGNSRPAAPIGRIALKLQMWLRTRAPGRNGRELRETSRDGSRFAPRGTVDAYVGNYTDDSKFVHKCFNAGKQPHQRGCWLSEGPMVPNTRLRFSQSDSDFGEGIAQPHFCFSVRRQMREALRAQVRMHTVRKKAIHCHRER